MLQYSYQALKTARRAGPGGGSASGPPGAAPVILYTDIESGPNTGGENNNGIYLSIFGRNFGSNIGALTVTIGGGVVASKIALGQSYGLPGVQRLCVQLGSNAATGPIKVSLGGVDSNTDKTFTVRAGDIYFVSSSGNNSTGVVNDIAHPYRDLNTVMALSAFGAGDFMVVRGGSYLINDAAENPIFGSWWRINKSGSSGNPLAVIGYPGENVQCQADAQTSLCGSSSAVGVAWFVMANFKLLINHCQSGNVAAIGTPRSDDPNCVGITKATDGRLVNFDVDGAGTHGMCSGFGDNMFEIGYSDRIKIFGMSVHDTSPAVDGEASHIYYSTATQTGTEWAYNQAYNIPRGRAVFQIHTDNVNGNCYGTKRLTDMKIHHNLVYNVAGQSMLFDGGTGDISVYNNILYNAPTPSPNTYEDIVAMRGSGGTLNLKFYNNTVYGNPFYTALGYMMGMGSVDFPPLPCPQSIDLKNNIFFITEAQDHYYQVSSNCGSTAYVTSDYNTYYGSSDSLPGFGGAHDLSSNPSLVNPGSGDVSLNTGSPAIGAGTSSVSSIVTDDFYGVPRGGTYDQGAVKKV